MARSYVLLVSFVIIFLVSQTECHNILAVFNIPSKSLHLAAISMVQILAEKGHNVTLVTAFETSQKHQDFTHVFLRDTAEVNEKTHTNFFEYDMNPYLIIYTLEHYGVENCKATFQDRAFKNLLNSQQKFDLLLVDSYMSPSILYLSEYYDVPVIIYSSFDSGLAVNPLVGNTAPPSYVPNVMQPYSSEMTFFQRLDNSFIFLLNELILHFYTLPEHDKIVKSSFPNAPDISQYFYKASVVLLNTDLSVTDASPRTPGMVNIGGYHINKPKPLPKDLQEIMDKSKDGVILFSLGSNVKSSQMPKSRVQEILQIFSRLKETVIWKWEDEDLPGKPSNVIVRKWLPQNDLLAHKNMKLFITHGGQHSILETVYYGIPCVSLSVFMDQGPNSFRAAKLGFAEWIPYRDFTAEKFEKAINRTLTDPRYTESARRRSMIMRDKILSPQETIAFWVDYVIRHDGAKHMQVAALKLHWYQYLLLDIVLFVLVCSGLFIFSVKFLVLFLLSSFHKNNAKKKSQ